MSSRRFRVGFLLFVGMGGCAVGPNYKTPEMEVPQAWEGSTTTRPTTYPTTTAAATTRPVDLAVWWSSLNDPVLDTLVARAVESNLDLRVATARVREARAQRGIVTADWWPQVDVGAAHAYRGGSLNSGPKTEGGLSLGERARATVVDSAIRSVGGALGGGTPSGVNVPVMVGNAVATGVDSKLMGSGAKVSRDQNLFQMGLDASWEIDVFGGTRRAVEAADADLAATQEGQRDVLVTLLSEVALNYVQLRGTQRRLAIARDNIRAQADTVDLTQRQFKAGFASNLEVAQARTQLASTQSQVPLLESTIKQAIFQISVLVGQPPVALLSELEKERPIPMLSPDTPIGLPSDLLRRRPDVRAAERQLAAATARIGEATADLFPRFSLTGSFSPQSRDIRHILDRNSMSWSVGPQMSWPVFDGWRIRSNIQVQNARQEQALASYEQIVLTAFRDVESALIAYANEHVRRQSLVEAVAAGQQSKSLSEELYTRGLTAFLNVLEAQRAVYSLQDQLAQSETTVVTNMIALYKALGGGWNPGTE